MTKQSNVRLTPVAGAVASVLTAGMMLGAASSASANPFQVTELSSGYMQLAKADGSCGEGKCGGNKGKSHKESKGEGSCGGAKKSEGSCGGAKGAHKKSEGSCGGAKGADKKSEGSCGGAKGAAKKDSEGACGGAA